MTNVSAPQPAAGVAESRLAIGVANRRAQSSWTNRLRERLRGRWRVWMPDPRCSMLDTGYSVPSVPPWLILSAGFLLWLSRPFAYVRVIRGRPPQPIILSILSSRPSDFAGVSSDWHRAPRDCRLQISESARPEPRPPICVHPCSSVVPHSGCSVLDTRCWILGGLSASVVDPLCCLRTLCFLCVRLA